MTICYPSFFLLFRSKVGRMTVRNPEEVIVNFLTANDDGLVVREIEITGENKVILNGDKNHNIAIVRDLIKEYRLL